MISLTCIQRVILVHVIGYSRFENPTHQYVCNALKLIIEDAWTKRGSSHIGCKGWEKWQKHYVFAYTIIFYTLMLCLPVSLTQCSEHRFTMKLTHMVEIGAV